MKKYLILLFVLIVSCSNTGKDEMSIPFQDLNAATTSLIVVYNANGAEGNPPIDTTTHRPNDIVTVLPNTNLAIENQTFLGWSFCSNCSAGILKPGSTFVITASTMLYACFTTTAYQVLYFSGEAEIGSPPVDSNYYITGEHAYILPNTGNLQKRDYKFNGWLNIYDQKQYTPGDAVYIENQNIELVAQFIPKPFTITYDANGATTGTVPVDSMFYEQGELVTIAHNTGNLAIINRDGVSYCFDVWCDSSDNVYLPGNTYPIEQCLILYARYRPFTVGDTGPCGGYVFYNKGYYSDSWRYLEAMRYDISSSGIVWEQQLQAGQYRQTGATASDIGTGYANTCTIIQVLGDGDYAAYACALYANGWHLPSKDELQLLFQNKSIIGNFASYNYWSSTESTTSKSWCQNFNNGSQSIQYKNNTYRVRAIRQF